jgi:hypothetical protein
MDCEVLFFRSSVVRLRIVVRVLGGERERCGRGACELIGSNGNTGLGARVDNCGDRDACVDVGLRVLLRVIERTACTRRVIKRTSLTKLGWACVQGYESRITLSSR